MAENKQSRDGKIKEKLILCIDDVKENIRYVDLDSARWPSSGDIEWIPTKLKAAVGGSNFKMDIFQKTYMNMIRKTIQSDCSMEKIMGSMAALVCEGLNDKFKSQSLNIQFHVEIAPNRVAFVIIEILMSPPEIDAWICPEHRSLPRQSSDDSFTFDQMDRLVELNRELLFVSKVLARFLENSFPRVLNYLKEERGKQVGRQWSGMCGLISSCMSLRNGAEADWNQFCYSKTGCVERDETPVLFLKSESGRVLCFQIVGLINDEEEAEDNGSGFLCRLECKNAISITSHVVAITQVGDNTFSACVESDSNSSGGPSSPDSYEAHFRVETLTRLRSLISIEESLVSFDIDKLIEFLRGSELDETNRLFKPKLFVCNSSFTHRMFGDDRTLDSVTDLHRLLVADNVAKKIDDHSACVDFSANIAALSECSLLRCLVRLTPDAFVVMKNQEKHAAALMSTDDMFRAKIGPEFSNFQQAVAEISNTELECDAMKKKLINSVRYCRNKIQHLSQESPIREDASHLFATLIDCLGGTEDEIAFRRPESSKPQESLEGKEDAFNVDLSPRPSDCLTNEEMKRQIDEINLFKDECNKRFDELSKSNEEMYSSMRLGHDNIEECPIETKEFAKAKFRQAKHTARIILPDEQWEVDFSSVSAFFRSISKTRKQRRRERRRKEKKLEEESKQIAATKAIDHLSSPVTSPSSKRSDDDDSSSKISLSPSSVPNRQTFHRLDPITTELEARTELIALIREMRKRDWHDGKNWNKKLELSRWDDVSVNSAGLLTKLDLSCCNIAGPLPESIGRFTSLKKLNLAGNEVTHIPDSICLLESLKELRLDGNPCVQQQTDRQRLKAIVRVNFPECKLIIDRDLQLFT